MPQSAIFHQEAKYSETSCYEDGLCGPKKKSLNSLIRPVFLFWKHMNLAVKTIDSL